MCVRVSLWTVVSPVDKMLNTIMVGLLCSIRLMACRAFVEHSPQFSSRTRSVGDRCLGPQCFSRPPFGTECYLSEFATRRIMNKGAILRSNAELTRHAMLLKFACSLHVVFAIRHQTIDLSSCGLRRRGFDSAVRWRGSKDVCFLLNTKRVPKGSSTCHPATETDRSNTFPKLDCSYEIEREDIHELIWLSLEPVCDRCIVCQTRLARGASLRVSIGDIADLLELSPREIEELRKAHNEPKSKEVRYRRNV